MARIAGEPTIAVFHHSKYYAWGLALHQALKAVFA
jgi:hypothetical protein